MAVTVVTLSCRQEESVELIKGVYSNQSVEEFTSAFEDANMTEEVNNIQYAYLDIKFLQLNVSSEIKFCEGKLSYVDVHPNPFSDVTYNDILNKLHAEKSIDLGTSTTQFSEGIGYSLLFDYVKPVLGHDTIIRIFDENFNFVDEKRYNWDCR